MQLRILKILLVMVGLVSFEGAKAAEGALPLASYERVAEWTIASHKHYADPFNAVDVDVIFTKDGQSWRVPTFWRGEQRWTVRFAPPVPGDYAYRLQSTDPGNPDLNGHEGRVTITAYHGPNVLLQHGSLRVSANKRYFEHLDGTPFYWLGDTWWTGLSDRLSWEGFQKLTADRKAKGFTLVQIVAGLVPGEERAPLDPGCRNEGGPVWEAQFRRINPHYFDYADRRIQHLVDQGLVPAITGAWKEILPQMGIAKMKQHWRYIIARYGAYPVFWVVGGEIFDPPEAMVKSYSGSDRAEVVPGWTEVTKYIRTIDPSHHPISAHEKEPPLDTPLQDETLTDFDLFQSGHFGWPSIGVEVAQMNQHYSRTAIVKPIVEGEIGYEKLGETHFEDFQRTAFWLAMLNGAAGYTYGANGTWEAYTGDKPLHRWRWSFLSWEEGMNLPGSYQIGLASKLLRQYPWWRFAPHPEWVTPRGSTLLEPHAQVNGFAFGSSDACVDCEPGDRIAELETNYAAAEWKERHGTFRLPYAAGVPREVRFVYVPAIGLYPLAAPTVLGLELGVRYHAYWWEPSSGAKIDLGAVEHPSQGAMLFDSSSNGLRTFTWKNDGSMVLLKHLNETNVVASVRTAGGADIGLVLRFQDADNYVAAVYSAHDSALFVVERRKGNTGRRLGNIAIPALGATIKLSAEVREDKAAASIADDGKTYETPIVDLSVKSSGSAGLINHTEGHTQALENFQLRRSPVLVKDSSLERGVYDAKGEHRGELDSSMTASAASKIPAWDDFGRVKHIVLGAYRPDRLPTTGDWVLVLEH